VDQPTASFEGPSVEVANELQREIGRNEADRFDFIDTATRARVLQRFAKRLLPPGFITWLRQWTLDAGDNAVLCVYSKDPRFYSLPWTEILNLGGVPVGRAWVVHVCRTSGRMPPLPRAQKRMILAGWARLTGYALPGVLREIRDLPQKLETPDFKIRILAEPTRDQLR